MAPWLRAVSFVFAFLFLITLVSAPSLDNPYLPIQKPDPLNLPDNVTLNITSNVSEYWSTDEGELKNVDDIYHNWLSGLAWSLAGHTIDTDIDMNSNSITNLNSIYWNLTADLVHGEGIMHWSDDAKGLEVGMVGNEVSLQIGQENLIYVKNNAGYNILNGQVVYSTGSAGNINTIDLTDIGDSDTLHIMGIATEDINNNQNGYITINGIIRDIDTTGTPYGETWLEGDKLYLNYGGNMSNEHPSNPNDGVVIVARVVRVHATVGQILVTAPQAFSLGNNYNGTLRSSIINKNESGGSSFTAVNDLGHRTSLSIFGSEHPSLPEVSGLYSEGYGKVSFVNDGNEDFVWYTDPTDSHNFSSLNYERMRLTSDGRLGLGTPSPDTNVEMYFNSSSKKHIGLKITNAQDNRGAGISFGEGGGAQFYTAYDGDTNNFQIYSSSYSNILSIGRSTGRTGLHFLNPVATFHVGNVGTDPVALFDTDTGNNPFYITRLSGINEGLKIYADDNNAVFESIQDEDSGTDGGMIFIIDDDGTASPNFNFKTKSGTSLMTLGEDGILDVEEVRAAIGNFTDVYVSNNTLYIGETISLSATNSSILNISGGDVLADKYYGNGTYLTDLNLSTATGTPSGGYIDKYSSGNFTGSLYTQKTNSSLSDSNALFTVLSDTKGTPQFQVQDGGANQASLMVRSWIVVNQNNTLLNSSQNNLCSAWGFEHLDCNTASSGADFGVTDDLEVSSLIYTRGGFRAYVDRQSAYFIASENSTAKYSGSNGFYNKTTKFFCDFVSDNFVDTGGWIELTGEASIFEGAVADIDDYVNSSCITVKNNPGWQTEFIGQEWKVVNSPDMVVVKGGFFEYYVGDDAASAFKIKTKNQTGHHSFIVDTKAGVDQGSSFSVHTDSTDKNGINGIDIMMSSSTGVDGVSSNAIQLIGDATGFNNSLLHFIDVNLIGLPGPGNDVDVININGDVGHIIQAGAASEVSKVYYEDDIGITDVTIGPNLIFEDDNSILYIGSDVNFTAIGIALLSGSSTTIAPLFYYCNDAGTYSLALGVTDSTSGFQSSGSIVSGNPIDRGKCNQAIDGTPFANTTNYSYIAIQRTRNNVNSPPILNSVSISGGSSQYLLAADYMKLAPADVAPITCDTTKLGAIYFDIGEDDMCVCKSSGWKVMQDGTDCV